MNILHTPIKWDDPIVKAESIATRYRKEQELTANEAINSCPAKSYAVELYAGTGGLTEIYKKYFDTVVTNDLNKNVDTQYHLTYHLTAEKFIEQVLTTTKRIDLIDFDCYGCPTLAIQEFFKLRKNYDAPFVLRFSDGLGLYMKRSKNQDVIRKRYLIEGEVVMDKIWLRHIELIDFFMKTIAGRYGMEAEKIISVQTKFKNYVLDAYKFTTI